MIPRSRLIDFAEMHYELGPEAAIPGKFKIINSPYLAEPARCLSDDPRTHIVTLQLAAQGGKNMLGEMWASYLIEEDPGNLLVYAQTDDDAQDFMEERLLKRMRSIPHLRDAIPDVTAAWRRNEVLLEHMYIKGLGANESNARGKSARYELNDELHLWKQGMFPIVKKRVSAFWDYKILNTSTAGEEGSEIDTVFKEGTMEDWHLGCPECKRPVRLRWVEKPRVLIWDANETTYPERKKWNYAEVRKTVRFKCPHDGCRAEFKDTTPVRREMNMLGSYVPTNKYATTDHRSFHVSQLAYQWVSWESIVEQWIKASEAQKRGDISQLRVFIIEVLAETWENRINTGGHYIATGDYSLADVFHWDEEHVRVMAVDVQDRGGRHMWWVVRAISKEGASRLVSCGRANTWGDVVRATETYHVQPRRVFVDVRFSPREVLQIAFRNKWNWVEADNKTKLYAHELARGARISRPWGPVSPRDGAAGTNMQGSMLVPGFRFSKDWARQAVHAHKNGQGSYWGLPSDITNFTWQGTKNKTTDYLSQLNSWVPVQRIDKRTNAAISDWKMIYGDDHLYACEEIILVASAQMGFVASAIMDEDESTSEAYKPA